MIVADTTVLVYAVGDVHPLRGPCRRLVQAAADGTIQLTTTIEVLQEFAHVRARRRPRHDAARLARQWLQLTEPVLRPTSEDLVVGLGLFEAIDTLGCFDAILAAAAIRIGATALVSADRAFARVGELPWLDPAAADFSARLGLP